MYKINFIRQIWLYVCCLSFMIGIFSPAIGADTLFTVGDKQLGVSLDGSRNYTLDSIWVKGIVFKSSGEFPCFTLFDEQGKEEQFTSQDKRWQVKTSTLENGAMFRYSYSGLGVDVIYQISNGLLTISAVPTSEGSLKFRAISCDSLVSIPSDVQGAESSGFIIRPHLSGELIRFPSNHENKVMREPQSWGYQASFVGLGYNGSGLIVRCPQYGAVWTAGTGNVGGIYSLFGGLSADYRPRRDNPGAYTFWKMPLVEPGIEIQLVPVRDVNKDGVFNWVDIGVTYRTKFIKRNDNLDKSELETVGGKIDISLPHTKTPLNYSELIEQLKVIDFAPQRWWLVGAHTPPGYRFESPPYSDFPEPSHNGPNGYDYFAFKSNAAKLGVKIGIHDVFQGISPLNKGEWGKVPLSIQEYGENDSIWVTSDDSIPADGRYISRKSLSAGLADGSFLRNLEQYFRNWDVKPGDSWHWDVFTAEGGRSDFSPEHYSTHGSDIRNRINILKYIKSKGIHITSEGLQEGMAEFCDFAWTARTDPGWVSNFTNGEPVPLVPVIFQGMTYYSVSWHPAWNLLFGGKIQYEGTMLNRDVLIDHYFGSTAFWNKIADRTVKNMVKTSNGWKVEYAEGGTLTVNLANMTPAMTFVLEIDGKIYTPDSPPASPLGVTARRINDKYELTYPSR